MRLFVIALTATLLTTATCSTIALVIAHDRSSYLKKTLRSLAAAKQSLTIPVYVSVDDNPKAYRAIRAAEFEPNTVAIWRQPAPPQNLSVREKIAEHYYHAFTRAFSDKAIQYVIVLEDDLLVSPDFITFLKAARASISSSDPGSIVCASGWNDNAFAEAPPDEWSLTSFFPGLGWLFHRSLWSELAPLWPHSNNTEAIVGIGWDFWLRVLFDERNWYCITPRLSRVKHLGPGANVNSADTQMYASMKVASEGVEWSDFHVDPVMEIDRVQKWLDGGTIVASVSEVLRTKPKLPVLPYWREDFIDIATQLGLWPIPRGHFRQTLRAFIEKRELLLFDEGRAERHWRIPKRDATEVVLVPSSVNGSCEEACAERGYECDVHALEHGNECEVLKQEFGCRGCSFETGVDLPAFVIPNAPLATAGWCLIIEIGLGPRGRLLCEGRFQWTERMCGCVPQERISPPEGRITDHDEL